MNNLDKINAIITTRINGNKIKGDKTYTNMLKSIKASDFKEYDMLYFNRIVTKDIYKKLDKIEKYVKLLENLNEE